MEVQELTIIEMVSINGGESFGYRAGQVARLAWDLLGDGLIDDVESYKILYDWFGEEK